MLIPIDDYTVAAEDAADLRDAVSTNNGINYVYLANNITLTGGITIYAGKASLVIDGEWPRGSGIIHTFTDISSTLFDLTLGIRSTSSIAITIRNMNINGGNYYGVPYIAENTLGRDTSGVSVIYERVTYTGPQLTYNCNGLTRYLDCNITISQTGTTAVQEVGEVNRVEIGGETRILHNSSQDAVFWFHGDTATMSLTILADARVNIQSPNSYFMYNMDSLWGTAFPVRYVIQSGAAFDLTVNRGISYDSRNQAASFLVEENASFHYIQTASNGTAATLYINGALTVRQGARFYMQAASGTQPLLSFTTNAQPSLTIDNPFSFVLYRYNTIALYSAGTTPFTIHGGQLNTWSNAATPVESAGTLDNPPEFQWFKQNYALPLEITGTFTQAATNINTNNLIADDQPYPALTNLHLNTARVLSVGDFPFTVNPVVTDGRPVTGYTYPNANLRVEYSIEEVEHLLNGQAEDDGSFLLATASEVPPEIPIGTDVTVWANIPFLFKRIETAVVAVGELLIKSIPEQIIFQARPISTNPVLLPRRAPEIPVVIKDSRVDSTQWELLASVASPLQTESGETLTEAVVFVENDGEEPVPLSSEPLVVFIGGPFVETTDVYWPEREGILVRVAEPIHSGVRYSAHVIWTLRAI